MDSPDDDPIPLKGKKILITGGTTGAGRATALLMARQGCRVFICGTDAGHLEEAISAIREVDGDVSGVLTDLATTEGILKLYQSADEWMGGVDIAILNAGVGAHGELVTMSHEECRKVIEVNLLAYISCALEAVRRMSENGGQIVMMGSMSAEVFDEHASVYVATKAGVRGFAYSLRKEANPRGIRVSLVEPGSIGTAMVDESPEEQRRMQEQLLMLRDTDIARTIHFILTQPKRCDVIKVQVRPHLQII